MQEQKNGSPYKTSEYAVHQVVHYKEGHGLFGFNLKVKNKKNKEKKS